MEVTGLVPGSARLLTPSPSHHGVPGARPPGQHRPLPQPCLAMPLGHQVSSSHSRGGPRHRRRQQRGHHFGLYTCPRRLSGSAPLNLQVRKVRMCGNPASMRVCGRSAVREAVREVRKAWRRTVRPAPPASGPKAPGSTSTSSGAPASLAGNTLPVWREDEPATAPHPGPAGHSSRSPRMEDRTRYTVHFSAPGGEALQPKCLPSVCRCPRSFSSRSAARSL